MTFPSGPIVASIVTAVAGKEKADAIAAKKKADAAARAKAKAAAVRIALGL